MEHSFGMEGHGDTTAERCGRHSSLCTVRAMLELPCLMGQGAHACYHVELVSVLVCPRTQTCWRCTILSVIRYFTELRYQEMLFPTLISICNKNIRNR